MKRVLTLLVEFNERWLPDPFIIALLLTCFVAVLALLFTPTRPYVLIQIWYRGLWDLLTFTMQMVLILTTGHALAVSRPVRTILRRFTRIPSNGIQAVYMCGLLAGMMSWIHWGLGLMAGALLAREFLQASREKGYAISFPLLAASGYIGLSIWHGGLSGSAPLLVATPHHFLEQEIGLIPTGETLFTPVNLIVSSLAILLLPALLAWFATFAPTSRGQILPSEEESFSETKEQHGLSGIFIGSIGVSLIALLLLRGTIRFNLNTYIGLFLFLGMVFHGTLRSYIEAFYDSARTTGPIILQFPLYGGIMGIMKGTGLVSLFANWLIHVPGTSLKLLGMYVSAGLVNLFVPSGGGQWAVQGPIFIEALKQAHLPYAWGVLALAYGDQWTNLIQPFWALPLLAITGLEAKDIMGYCMLLLFFHAVLYGGALILLPILG